MDPKEYDRIADLLMQIRKKIDNLPVNSAPLTAYIRDEMLREVNWLLETFDKIGEWDAKGWL